MNGSFFQWKNWICARSYFLPVFRCVQDLGVDDAGQEIVQHDVLVMEAHSLLHFVER